jgi:hypothetical protein
MPNIRLFIDKDRAGNPLSGKPREKGSDYYKKGLSK